MTAKDPRASERRRSARARGSQHVVAALALVVTSLCIAACGISSGGSGANRAVSGAAAPAGSGTSHARGARRGGITLDYVADSDSTVGVEHLRLTILDLRRVGPFLQLDFAVHCLAPSSGCAMATDLQGYSPDSSQTADGIALVDPLGNREYLPVEDAQGNVDGSAIAGGTPSQPATLAWVRFAGPPITVRALDVTFPDGGPQVSNVPIVAGPGPKPSQVGAGVTAPRTAAFAAPPGNATTGLTPRIESLVLRVGNPRGSDQESGGRALITLGADLLFRAHQSALTSAGHDAVTQVAATLATRGASSAVVTGYTDSTGSPSADAALSKRRALAVVAALRAAGAGAVQFKALGLGSNDPVAPGSQSDGSAFPQGLALNRRVTIQFKGRTAPPTLPATDTSDVPPQHGAGSVTYHALSDGPTPTPFRVSATALYRVGDLLVLRFTALCQGQSDCSGLTTFAGSETSVPPTPTFNDTFVDASPSKAGALYLRDPATGAEYVPVYNATTDTDQNPLTATVGGSSTVTLPLWAYFPAPPATVHTLDVVMPGGHSQIVRVPITG